MPEADPRVRLFLLFQDLLNLADFLLHLNRQFFNLGFGLQLGLFAGGAEIASNVYVPTGGTDIGKRRMCHPRS